MTDINIHKNKFNILNNKFNTNTTIMKKQLQRVLLLAVCSLFFYAGNAQVKIGDNQTTIDASALLELENTTKGFLPPRMTTAQVNAIASPATGLMVYNTSLLCLQVNDGTPASPNWNCASGLAGVTPGSVASLDCAGATNSGTLTSGQVASGVSSVISYTGGNGNAHSGQSVVSTGVTGLTAAVAAGNFATGAGSLTYTITGTPAAGGTASFAISIGGQTCTLTITVATGPTTITGYTGAPTACATATISAAACSSVSGATANDDAGTTLGTEYDWTGATTSGMADTSTTRVIVDISGQCWMRYNMDSIPSNYSPVPTWVNYTDVGSSGYYTGGPHTNEGRLYQWSAAMNGSTAERAQGVCPTGWHVPSDCEIMYLESNLGMSTADQGNTGWRYSGTVGSKLSTLTSSGNNNSGFTGLFSGYLHDSGIFYDRGTFGFWWSSSEASTTDAYNRYVLGSQTGVYRTSNTKALALSVRCLKD